MLEPAGALPSRDRRLDRTDLISNFSTKWKLSRIENMYVGRYRDLNCYVKYAYVPILNPLWVVWINANQAHMMLYLFSLFKGATRSSLRIDTDRLESGLSFVCKKNKLKGSYSERRDDRQTRLLISVHTRLIL